MKRVSIALWLAVACGGPQVDPDPSNPGEMAIQSEDAIAAELIEAAPSDRWSTVPQQYHAWAEEQLRDRVRLGASNLRGAAPSDVGRAAAAVPRMTAVIEQFAREECSPLYCLGHHSEQPPVVGRLRRALCPGFFPFC